MKFFYQPNCHVIDYENMKEMFVFDENGEFETDDPKLIAWMRKYKSFIQYEETPKKQESTTEQPQIDGNTETKKHVCKQCGQEFDNMGKLLAHIRKEHPKGGD